MIYQDSFVSLVYFSDLKDTTTDFYMGILDSKLYIFLIGYFLIEGLYKNVNFKFLGIIFVTYTNIPSQIVNNNIINKSNNKIKPFV